MGLEVKPVHGKEACALKVLRSIAALRSLPGPVALAIGTFDGLHRGHQEVVRAALEHARRHQGSAVLMTFDPHPLQVLRPEAMPRRLMAQPQLLRAAADLGLDAVLLCPFNREVAAMEPPVFVRELAGAALPLGCISVGYEWAFGKGRAGNVHLLMELGAELSFDVYGVAAVREGGRVISSTWVRELLAAGDVEAAAGLLGRPHALMGGVGQGRKLGRELGFPTANVALAADAQLPATGVYAVWVRLDEGLRPAVANLGVRPTIAGGDARPGLEVHLLSWSGDLYGRELEVLFGTRLRDEQRFDSLDELRAQIAADTIAAEAFFRERGSKG